MEKTLALNRVRFRGSGKGMIPRQSKRGDGYVDYIHVRGKRYPEQGTSVPDPESDMMDGGRQVRGGIPKHPWAGCLGLSQAGDCGRQSGAQSPASRFSVYGKRRFGVKGKKPK